MSTPASARYGQTLTAREVQALQLAAAGQSNAAIGAALFLTENTVKTHLRRAFCKLGASDRAHAVILATRRGLIDLRAIQPTRTDRSAR